MLPTSYFVNISTAERKSTGQSYRVWLVQSLIDTYDRTEHNIVESSHMLFDAARVIGLHKASKVSDNWLALIRSINVEQPLSIGLDEATQKLQQETKQVIKEFQGGVFTHFSDFKDFWCAKKFNTTQDYLDDFYRYIPYSKLGIDEEQLVKDVMKEDDVSILKLGLVRQRAVIDRVKTVFQSNIPQELPEAISESLIDYAVRTGEDNIPLENVPV